MENHKRFLEAKEKLIKDVNECISFVDETIEFIIKELMKSEISGKEILKKYELLYSNIIEISHFCDLVVNNSGYDGYESEGAYNDNDQGIWKLIVLEYAEFIGKMKKLERLYKLAAEINRELKKKSCYQYLCW